VGTSNPAVLRLLKFLSGLTWNSEMSVQANEALYKFLNKFPFTEYEAR
jgi:hypothetical protein